MVEILEKEEDLDEEGAEESDLPTDEQLNEMLARTEAEFDLFQEMDAKRYAAASEWQTETRRDRLMQPYELPDWMMKDDSEVRKIVTKVDEIDTANQGKGRREKKSVVYTDGLSEEAWCKAIEEGNLEETEAEVQLKLQRKRAREAKQAKKVEEATRRDKVSRGKRQKFDRSGDFPLTQISQTAKRNKEVPKKVQIQIDGILKAVLTHTALDGRLTSGTFAELPDPEINVEYYQKVRNPLCFSVIKSRVEAAKYSTVSELETDLRRLLDDALKGWPDKESPEHEDARTLLEVLDSTMVRYGIMKPAPVASGKLTSKTSGIRIRISMGSTPPTHSAKPQSSQDGTGVKCDEGPLPSLKLRLSGLGTVASSQEKEPSAVVADKTNQIQSDAMEE